MWGVKSKWSRALLLLQTDTKPVQMMSLEATFCMGNIDSINCKVIELPFQNKHLSMLILLPKDLEDESTGLEKVRGGAVPRCPLPWRSPWTALCGAVQGAEALPHTSLALSSPGLCGPFWVFLLNVQISWHLFGTYHALGTVNSLCVLSH